MKVKDLIDHLSGYDLDSDFEISVESEVEGDMFGITLENAEWKGEPFKQLVIRLDDYVLLDKGKYEEMLRQLEKQK